MIIDTLTQIHRYSSIHPLLTFVGEFLSAHDLSGFECGKELLGRGITLGIDEYMTVADTEKNGEFHEKYIDVQLVVTGIEMVGYASRSVCTMMTEYNPEKDVCFAEGAWDYFLLQPGSFTLFFPQDVHKPGVWFGNPLKVRKAVFKIPV